MEMEFFKALRDVGAIALVAYMIWQGGKREERSSATFDALNKSVAERDRLLIDRMATLSEKITSLPCVKDDEK